jgi:hypothetical protein
MLILLGGVWIVSIQSGGGGVNVGTWQKGDEEDSASLGAEDDVEIREESSIRDDRVSVTVPESPLSGMRVSSSPLVSKMDHIPRRSTISIPSLEVLMPSSPHHERRMTDSVVLSPSSTMTRHRRRRTISRSSISPPPAPFGIPGGGFQIGLSPLSPGFSLVPSQRLRRRVTSGLVLGFPVDGEEGEGEGSGTSRRRTVSEGDLRRGSDEYERGAGEEEMAPLMVGGRRWKWLRRLFAY